MSIDFGEFGEKLGKLLKSKKLAHDNNILCHAQSNEKVQIDLVLQ